MKKEKVCLYARVSTEHQSTDSQLSTLKTFCEARGFEIGGIYQDIMSGSKESRPELNRMMNDVRKGHYSAVLVFRLDRFSRSTSQLVNALNEFQALKVDFISYSENLNTLTPSGKLMFGMIAVMAEFERNIIRERVIAGLNTVRKKGVKLGRPSFVNTDQVRELLMRGYSITSIAKELDCSRAAIQRLIKMGVVQKVSRVEGF